MKQKINKLKQNIDIPPATKFYSNFYCKILPVYSYSLFSINNNNNYNIRLILATYKGAKAVDVMLAISSSSQSVVPRKSRSKL